MHPDWLDDIDCINSISFVQNCISPQDSKQEVPNMVRYSDPRAQTFDYSRYQGEEPREVFYGLPEDIRFCTRCVISNQRPSSAVEFKHTKQSLKQTIRFDDEGVCDACRMAERKRSEIDWAKRERELLEICDKYRSRNGSFDCVVPGSGGKDSFYAAHLLKYKYGMNPLTVTWAPHKYTTWGWENFQSWIHAGFDNFLITPNGKTHRILTRLAIENLFHPFQPFILGQKYIAAKMSILHKIPLVFYGENEAEYGNPISDNDSAERDWRYFSAERDEDIYLGGVSVAELKADFGLSAADISMYTPPSPSELSEVGTQVYYLGYYLKWHPQSAYYYSVENSDFKASPERTPGTYSKYNSIDDRIDDLHYYTTYVKFGIGRATYDAAQEIRSGDILRDEGVALVRRFDGEWPARFENELMDYISLHEDRFPECAHLFEAPVVDTSYFHALANKFRSPHLWDRKNGEWVLRNTVFGQAR